MENEQLQWRLQQDLTDVPRRHSAKSSSISPTRHSFNGDYESEVFGSSPKTTPKINRKSRSPTTPPGGKLLHQPLREKSPDMED